MEGRGLITINFGQLHDANDYEWKYVKIIQDGLYYAEERKFRRIKDLKSYGVGHEKYRELHFTVVRRNRSYRMVVLGKIVEMMSRDL